MSAFEQISSFRMFCFVTNDHKVIAKCRWGSGGAVSSVVGSWQSFGTSSRGKSHEKFWSFYVWRAKKYLEMEES